MVFIFKYHFDEFQNQPPGQPQEQHLSEVLHGSSKSKFNIILSYSKFGDFSSGFHNLNYLEENKILFKIPVSNVYV